jgi:hypothetical protein
VIKLSFLDILPLEKEFKQTIGSGEGEMFSLTKEENSNILLISLLSKDALNRWMYCRHAINLQHWHQEQLFVKIRFLNLKSQIKHRLCKFSPCCFYEN